MDGIKNIGSVPTMTTQTGYQRTAPPSGNVAVAGAAGAPVSNGKVNQENPQVTPVVDVRSMVDEMNRFVQRSTNLNFRVDGQGNRLVVSIVDTNTREVIRQIPSDSMLELSERMRELKGILFDSKA